VFFLGRFRLLSASRSEGDISCISTCGLILSLSLVAEDIYACSKPQLLHLIATFSPCPFAQFRERQVHIPFINLVLAMLQ
jgi:hypothetical protein